MSVAYGLVARYPPDPCKGNAEKNPTKRDAVRGRSRVGIFQLTAPCHSGYYRARVLDLPPSKVLASFYICISP